MENRTCGTNSVMDLDDDDDADPPASPSQSRRSHQDSTGRDVKRILDQWEPDDFRAMAENPIQIAFVGSRAPAAVTFKKINNDIITKIDGEVATWPVSPSPLMLRAIRILALYVDALYVWKASNDMLATQVLDLVHNDTIRAHSDGVTVYSDGGWAYIDEFAYQDIASTLEVLATAAKLLKQLSASGVQRTWPMSPSTLTRTTFCAQARAL